MTILLSEMLSVKTKNLRLIVRYSIVVVKSGSTQGSHRSVSFMRNKNTRS